MWKPHRGPRALGPRSPAYPKIIYVEVVSTLFVRAGWNGATLSYVGFLRNKRAETKTKYLNVKRELMRNHNFEYDSLVRIVIALFINFSPRHVHFHNHISRKWGYSVMRKIVNVDLCLFGPLICVKICPNFQL